jgi:SNF2 family DNA or RNA helicase
VPLDDWPGSMAERAFSGISRLLALIDLADGGAAPEGDGVRLSHEVIASLTEPQALGLGLPPSVRQALHIETRNLITDSDFRIFGRWVDDGGRLIQARREGAFVFIDTKRYRVPAPLYGLVEAIESFAKPDNADNDIRMERIANLHSLLPDGLTEQLSVDPYFSSFRVVHASAFSLSLRADGQSFDFDPVLFGRRVLDRIGDTDAFISEAEGLLTEHQHQLFSDQRFRSSDVVKPSYVIEHGVYVHLDAALRDGLNVVRGMQLADAPARKRFAQKPQLYLKEALFGILTEEEVERLFIETEQYSERVVDIGVWAAPVLPWIKRDPNDWLPEKFGIKIGEQYIVLSPDELGPLSERIRDARTKGQPFVEVGHDNVRIPTSIDAEESLRKLISETSPSIDSTKRPVEDKAAQPIKQVLIVEENFDNLGFTRKLVPRTGAEPHQPVAIRPAFKPHQNSGLAWMQEAWMLGFPGVLLADDMGLGKTLQALAFLAWLRELANGIASKVAKGPALVVAPTGLLGNWEKEHGLHLHEPGLGDLCRAYGRHLKLLKAGGRLNGAPTLDQQRLRQSDWVLTTYETLQDYHLSFAAVRFSCVIFDEMQKVKSPTSLLTRAAKAVNAEFTLGLTGTPIENHLADLWCIMDIIYPGRLGDLKTFAATYKSEEMGSLEQLRSMLLDRTPDKPSPILRRMKAGNLEGLPQKIVHIRRRTMPEIQARIYDDVVARAKQPEAGPMLQTLHLLRSVALHPTWPPASEISDVKGFVEQSARLVETFSILDEIHSRREKVLIFLESLDLQDHLALIIKTRYGLKRRPMQINGDVAGEKRQGIVDEFQSNKRDFGAMILSPRAGGVGLTLTSANHVIHLSRWWNPAVEDQCTDRVYRIGQSQTVHVYYPIAVHPHYGDGSFDILLDKLLEGKRELSKRMLIPPVNLKQDQKWFAENLGRKPDVVVELADIDEIDIMEPRAFETWALRRCVPLGWSVSRTPGSHDGGADGLLVHLRTKARVIVQCKHRERGDRACGAEAVDDLLRARSCFGSDVRLFALTNAVEFSRAAHDRAERYGIALISRKELPHWPRHLL